MSEHLIIWGVRFACFARIARFVWIMSRLFARVALSLDLLKLKALSLSCLKAESLKESPGSPDVTHITKESFSNLLTGYSLELYSLD